MKSRSLDSTDDPEFRVNIEEKAGQFFHFILFTVPSGILAETTPKMNSIGSSVGTQYLAHFSPASAINTSRYRRICLCLGVLRSVD